MKRLMVFDGNSIANRAFYGVHNLSAPDGTPTNAVFGFFNIYQHFVDKYHPDAVFVAFDRKEPTFRHRANANYKAQRKGMPDELSVQMPLIKELVSAFGATCYELAGYEADDIIGTISKKSASDGWSCIIVTGDKDSLQLVSESTTVCNVKTKAGQTETIEYTPVRFMEEYGFEPIHMIDLKALMGDSSDNISGVPGIGEKTALELVRKYRDIDTLYQSLSGSDLKESVKKKLLLGEQAARESLWLATIFCEVPIIFSSEDEISPEANDARKLSILKRLGFFKLIEKLQLDQATISNPIPSGYQKIIELSADADYFPLFTIFADDALVSVDCTPDLNELSICDGKAVYHSVWSRNGDKHAELLRKTFCDDTKKIGHAIKDLQHVLLEEGLSTKGFIFDTELAAYLLNATESDYSLKRITPMYCSSELESAAYAIYELYPILDTKLKDLGLHELYYSVELPLCEVLAEMEHAGFLVDRAALHSFGNELSRSIEILQEDIWRLAGRAFNINSPKQLGQVLFEELMLPSGKKTKTGWSTNAEVLEKLRGKHPIVEQILDYRMLSKLKSTYADGLLKTICEDGRIHTNFQMTVTATGRLSSTEPNLQNIPIRNELGAEIRKMFIASPGNVLVDADYSQIELRLLAHIANDEAMQAAFSYGEDFHAVTASRVFDIPLNEVTPILRSRAKAVNFGVIYGMSAFALGQDLHVSTADAAEYIRAYYEKYPNVRLYMTAVVEKAKQDGYVTTLYGRRRALPELKSANFGIRQFGERVALNMPIQGTAADIMKLAMIRTSTLLKESFPNARLLLQVHDELIVECAEEDKEQICILLQNAMENAVQLSVPLTVEAKYGKSWADAH